MLSKAKISFLIFFFLFFQLTFCTAGDDSIAIIQIYNQKDKVIGKEAGIFISENEVLTHYYVFSGVERAVLKSEGKEFEIKGICGRNTEKKLLKIKIAENGFKKADFAREIKENEKVYIKVPGEDAIRGKIISIEDRIKIEIDSKMPKIRGLPVFNKEGQVLGIIEFFIRDKNYVYAIPTLKGISFENIGLLNIKEWKEKRAKEWMESDTGKRQIIVYLMGMSKYEEATIKLKELIKEHPDDKEAYFKLGVCYGKSKRYREAIEAYKKYNSLSPDDFKAHYNLGILYISMADIEAAKKEYKLLKGFNSKEAAALSDRLLEYIEKENHE
ncbi:MAG: tetratricopeptide repeat protein [Candidatus Aureabacteria bacterium]|nr:tetratricopeptide repeat protein [Candidatus Auribacterota bacterium]